MDFEWDDDKAERNFKKHGVRFSEAATVWLDENALEMFDPDHSEDEDRWIRLGYSAHARALVIVYCEKIPDEVIRIVSARKATPEEELQYRQR